MNINLGIRTAHFTCCACGCVSSKLKAVITSFGMAADILDTLQAALMHSNSSDSEAKVLFHILEALIKEIVRIGVEAHLWPRPFYISGPPPNVSDESSPLQQRPTQLPEVQTMAPPLAMGGETSFGACAIMPRPVQLAPQMAKEPLFMSTYNLGTTDQQGSGQVQVFRAPAASPGHRYAKSNDAAHPLAMLWGILCPMLIQMSYEPFNPTIGYRLPDKLHGGVVRVGVLPHMMVNKAPCTAWWALLIQQVSNRVQDQLVLDAMLGLLTQVSEDVMTYVIAYESRNVFLGAIGIIDEYDMRG